MCRCTPEKKTPFCGKPGYTWPISGTDRPSLLDILLDVPEPAAEDGSQLWFAVSNPRAVRCQPMALFRTETDAQLVGGSMILAEIEIVPVRITLPPEVRKDDAPMPPVTVIG